METDTTNTTQETQFILRRLEEALRLFGRETDPHWFWILVLVVVLAVGFAYVIWMYKRDSQSVGWGWAALLAALRCTVYAILAAVFLLPALQTWEKTQFTSKVVLACDVSGSMGNRDDLPTETMPVEKLPSRQDKVIQFLSDERIGFLKSLQEKNPVFAYRFGSRADEQYKVFEGGKVLSASEWAEWLKPNVKEALAEGLADEDKARAQKRLDLVKALVNGTDIAGALTDIHNREANNMVQAIVVFSDGRSPQSTADAYEDLKVRARRAKVPIFTVAIGEFRQPISITNLALQSPDQARPDDKFLIRVEVDGEGLPNRESIVYLDITGPKGDKLPALEKPFTFNAGAGGAPHAQIEFEIDAAKLGVVATPPKKAELEEGDYIFQARIPKDKREVFVPKEHLSDKATVHVVKKPLRVLLFAGGPTRDYQFVRTMLVREMDAKRAEVSIFLQTQREGVVQDVPAEQFLKYFPNRMTDDAEGQAAERYYNLSQYDLIVAFDPDWTALTPEQMNLLEKWVHLHSGGLVLVAGHINTYQLARPGNRDNVKPILNLYPVILQDSLLFGLGGGGDRPTSEAWRLNFPGATKELEFLKLDEESADPLAGWDEFFTGLPRAQVTKETPVVRGFYSYYPVEDKKATAITVATFSDPRARLKDGNREQPFLVTMPYGSGKVVYVGSGEMWRLRQYKEAFLERFWTKLCRYAGSGNMARQNKHGDYQMASSFSAGQFAVIRAKLFGRDMLPLSQTAKPKAVLKPPPGVTMQTNVELQAEPTQGNEWSGYFSTRVRILTAGQYQVDMQIPESGEMISRRFVVKESNPELDDTRPDFGQLYQLASEVTDFLPRMDKDTQNDIKDALGKTAAGLLHRSDEDNADAPRRGAAKDKAPKAAAKQPAGENKEVQHFFFDLTSARLIPRCMVTESKTQRSRGPVKDLWDQGFTISDNPAVRMATVLIVVTLLLSGEWLTRKLLKLA